MEITRRLKDLLAAINNLALRPIDYTSLYFSGIALTITAAFFIIIFGPLKLAGGMILLYIGSLFLALGFCWEFISWVKRIPIITSIIITLPSSALVTSIAAVVAENLINQATGIYPTYFDNSLNILTILSIPIVLAYLVSILLLIYYTVYMPILLIRFFWGTVKKTILPNNKGQSINMISIARPTAAAIFLAHILILLNYVPPKVDGYISKAVKIIVGLADHYEYGPCKNISPKSRYRLLPDGGVSAAKIDEKTNKITFEEVKCNKD
ncbi:hypothetical protein AB835_11115 [Candidatus Endobugula sertula]|uniref:Uncharacterized protein n=1 Tax=Candidatus Endobugula sertula TaxID=62101 RepID=A0A1D2QN70_9GAMM|nr:hypothetical protein AB835_11115 [Candidatus Endobugula sertula]